MRCLFLDRSADAPGAQVAPILVGDLEDAAKARRAGRRSDVVTFDWENISGSALAPLEKSRDSPAARGARGIAGSLRGKSPVHPRL
jgi:phosphoribosylaminoimidazole carboxylase (NCAIR synthetase)